MFPEVIGAIEHGRYENGALAMRPKIDRPSLGFAAAGKITVFLTVLGLWLGGEASGGLVILVSGDLAFGMVWGWWLVSTKGTPPWAGLAGVS